MPVAALLIKKSANDIIQLNRYYLNSISTVATTRIHLLKHNKQGKAPVKVMHPHIVPILDQCLLESIELLIVADAAYFKYLTKIGKVEFSSGYIKPCKLKGYETFKIAYIPNYQVLFYKPDQEKQIQLSLKTIQDYFTNTPSDLGKDVIQYSWYPTGKQEIVQALSILFEHKMLTCDVETESLKLSPIRTIAFGIDEHKGVAFKVTKKLYPLLKYFFTHYKGTLIFHNATFDTKQCIWNFFMNCKYNNYSKALEGIKIFYKNLHDTKIITYLCHNSTARPSLGLKENAFEFSGDYAPGDMKHLFKLPLQKVLEYNLTDALSTWFVFNKNYPKLQTENQLDIYNTLMLPSLKVITNMELVGLPLDMPKVHSAIAQLETHSDTQLAKLRKTKPIMDWEAAHNTEFNINSFDHKHQILYETFNLPVINTTPSGAPSTDADTLDALIKYPNIPQYIIDVIEYIKDLSTTGQILGTFLKTFRDESIKDEQGNYYIQGNFNLGGTISGRLSSSNPNLQNIPSHSFYAKLIKECFKAPKGWVFCGADFNGLEDRISALTTKDPNKIKVFTDGYDGHCLRAFYYFKDQLPDIVETVDSINSIEDKYPDTRQASKSPTFALTYRGTWRTLMKKFGFSEPDAKRIEKQYLKLYEASVKWVDDKLAQACIDGFVTVAFGLKLRTPTLKNSILNTKNTPYQTYKDAKTAGNALGQSYGLLNNRAANELWERLDNSPYQHDIKPVAQIHDAQYYLVRDNAEIICWLNDNLIECMEWQNLPEIYHPEVKLGGKLELFIPDWSQSIPLPNKCSTDALNTLKRI